MFTYLRHLSVAVFTVQQSLVLRGVLPHSPLTPLRLSERDAFWGGLLGPVFALPIALYGLLIVIKALLLWICPCNVLEIQTIEQQATVDGHTQPVVLLVGKEESMHYNGCFTLPCKRRREVWTDRLHMQEHTDYEFFCAPPCLVGSCPDFPERREQSFVVDSAFTPLGPEVLATSWVPAYFFLWVGAGRLLHGLLEPVVGPLRAVWGLMEPSVRGWWPYGECKCHSENGGPTRYECVCRCPCMPWCDRGEVPQEGV
jgi:hypothetical protein